MKSPTLVYGTCGPDASPDQLSTNYAGTLTHLPPKGQRPKSKCAYYIRHNYVRPPFGEAARFFNMIPYTSAFSILNQ